MSGRLPACFHADPGMADGLMLQKHMSAWATSVEMGRPLATHTLQLPVPSSLDHLSPRKAFRESHALTVHSLLVPFDFAPRRLSCALGSLITAFRLQPRALDCSAWIGIAKIITASTVAGLLLRRCSLTQFVAAVSDLYSSACRVFVMVGSEVQASLLIGRCCCMDCL